MHQRQKILIVEDDNDLRKSLKDKLFRGYEILEASDGEQAVALCVDHRPQLILLDLLLPKLDGFKVLERIRNYPDPEIAKTKVIVLSNLFSQKDILQAKGLKIDEYFVKAHTKIQDVVARAEQVLSAANTLPAHI